MPPAILYRFDELQFAEPFVQHGVLSFGPAASYNDSRLSVAQQDDELRRQAKPKVPGHQLFIGQEGGLANVIQNLLSMSLTYDIKLDGKYLCYYTLCCSLQNDPKFYEEFPKSNCMVTINDVEAFEARIIAAIAATYPDWQGRCGGVEYYDRKQSTPPAQSLISYSPRTATTTGKQNSVTCSSPRLTRHRRDESL